MTGPMQHTAFRWFFTGRLISLTGSSMAPVALAFAVLGYSKAATDLGLVLAARSVPLLVFLLVGGAVADRFSRSAVLRISNLGAAVTQGLVAFLLISGRYDLAEIAVLEFFNGALTAFTSPAMRGIVPQLVDAGQKQRANSLLGSSKKATSILGPTVAGVAVTTVGGGWAIAVDSASFLVAALCMARLNLPQRVPAKASTVLSDIREGWAEFRSLTWVVVIVATFALMNCIYVGVWNVLGPATAKATVGATSWGLVLSAWAAGTLLMSVAMYRITARRLLMVGQMCVLAGAVPLVALGLHAGVAWLLPAAFAAGLGQGIFGVAWETSLQEHVPNRLMSRVSSYDDLGSFIAVPVGQVVAAPLAAAFGTSRVIVTGGILYATLGAFPLLFSVVRQLRQPFPEQRLQTAD